MVSSLGEKKVLGNDFLIVKRSLIYATVPLVQIVKLLLQLFSNGFTIKKVKQKCCSMVKGLLQKRVSKVVCDHIHKGYSVLGGVGRGFL